MSAEPLVDPFVIPVPQVEQEPSVFNGEMDERGFATDIDTSLRFAKANSALLRYSPGIGWLFWDSRRWKEDSEGKAIELSKKCARKWTMKAARSENPGRLRGALSLESASHVRAAVDLAKSDPRLVINAVSLDTNPWILNVQNGTLDLRTGDLRPHRREDFCTKVAPVEFRADAGHPVLMRFLEDCERATPGMAPFLARCFGAALSGDASSESLYLLQGDGGSGKTTLVEAIAAMLGDYAVKLPFESFCQSKHGRTPGAASSDLMRLRGSRLAYASEGDQSARLDAGVVKALTGNEPITARALYSAPITFLQTWKLWLVTNFDPKADSEDSGIWRRMLKLQFAVIPKESRDPAVKRVLTSDPAARSALLAWALTGCLDWQARGGGREGLAPPDAVQAITDAYRSKQDTLGEWWEDLLTADADLLSFGATAVGEVRKQYVSWCEENGSFPISVKRFTDYLESKGLTRARGAGGTRMWRGLKMRQ
jgi:putative DNA primase/helicase